MPLSEELGSHLLCQINLRVNLPVPRAAAVKWGSVWRNQVPWYWADALLTLKWCIPVPSWSKWWQRRNSRWANWKDMQRDGTNHGVKQESTLVQAARAVGVTSGSQVLWEPDSLAELWKTKEAQWPLLPRITKAQCLSKAITGNSTVNILIIKYQCSTHTQEFVFFYFTLCWIFYLDYLQKASKLFFSLHACSLRSNPFFPILISHNLWIVWCDIGVRRSQLWAWLCCLKPGTSWVSANIPLLLYLFLLSTLTFRELIYTLYWGPTGYGIEWHR